MNDGILAEEAASAKLWGSASAPRCDSTLRCAQVHVAPYEERRDLYGTLPPLKAVGAAWCNYHVKDGGEGWEVGGGGGRGGHHR